MENKIPIRINEIIRASVNRFGKEGDPIFIHKNFIIFLKNKDKINVRLNEILKIRLNEILKIRINKILPKFAIAELAK